MNLKQLSYIIAAVMGYDFTMVMSPVRETASHVAISILTEI